MERDQFQDILDHMYHISGVEATGIANALLLKEYDRLTKALDDKRPTKCVWTCDKVANPDREWYHRGCDGKFSTPTASWRYCPICGGEIVRKG